jgi:ferritin
MISDKMTKEINAQITRELYSAYLYLAMSADAMHKGFKGAAHWFAVQFREEQGSAERAQRARELEERQRLEQEHAAREAAIAQEEARRRAEELRKRKEEEQRERAEAERLAREQVVAVERTAQAERERQGRVRVEAERQARLQREL